MKKVLFILGTRPEVIKFAPLIEKLSGDKRFDCIVCFTGQHREMLYKTAAFFGIKADHDLSLMVPNQSLAQFVSSALVQLDLVIKNVLPDLVFVQGDTSTVFSGSLAAFYNQVPVAHLEAGLRSHDKYSPFPEEINRSLCSRIADYHFAPTENARQNLIAEGIRDHIHVVGNTVIDALHLCLAKIKLQGEEHYYHTFPQVDFNQRIVLLTCHRRESFGAPLLEILHAMKTFALQFKDIQIIYPVHLNPNINEVVYTQLSGISNILLLPPLDYPDLVWMMSKSYFVVTDSGGLQEEAPALNKPVLVLRENTERIESIQSNKSVLVGHDYEKILDCMTRLCRDGSYYHSFEKESNPYGDGNSSAKIIEILAQSI
jgi:UDP-N-acetylglucosamine 2-epimerase (non-hydrolysing)